MEMDGTCFWWDGGFECVHNRPDPCKNPREIAHAVSEYYRIDISRKEAAVVGLGAFDEGNVTQGLILPPPSIGIQMRMRVSIDGKVYILQPERDGAKSLMVYDSGKICHQLRLKGCGVYDNNGNKLPGVEIEEVFYLWKDYAAISFHLVDTVTRLPFSSEKVAMQAFFSFEGATLEKTGESVWLSSTNGGFMVYAEDKLCVLNEQTILACTEKKSLVLSFEPLRKPNSRRLMQRKMDVGIESNAGGCVKGEYDPVVGGWVLPLMRGNEGPYRIVVRSPAEELYPVRILLMEEGNARIQADGTVIPMCQLKTMDVCGIYAYGTDIAGKPAGTCWQISVNGHEFENYPRPYSHRWIHLYTEIVCSNTTAFEEILYTGVGECNGFPIASFCQLSLLGWDDNPRFGNPKDITAVQLWVQGVIGKQEILCICPESHMTDSAITDIRPVDAGHVWGPNNGGGDFLRYRAVGDLNLRKMCAGRCEFFAYGPLLSTVNMYAQSEDNAIHGEIQISIFAARDVARVVCCADYIVQRDINVEEMTFAWLGCPGYDRSRYARFAWGVGKRVCEDAVLEYAKGQGEVLIQDAVADNSWYSAYFGGIIDEQYREPNGNKAMILRESWLCLREYPDTRLQAKRIRIDAFDGLTTQYWLGLYPKRGILQLKAGDKMHLVWEYVPTVKYARDCARSETAVYNLLRDNPDSFAVTKYEADCGAWDLTAAKGRVKARWPIIQVELAYNDTSASFEGQFGFTCGVGYMPVQICLGKKPKKIDVHLQSTYSKIAHSIPYQLDCIHGIWVATYIIQTSMEELQERQFWSELSIRAILES